MGETVGKSKIVKNIAKSTNVNAEVCERIVDALTDEIVAALVRGDKLAIKNFMTIEVIERAARDGKDLKTGKPVTYPPVKSVKCKISKAVKDAVNGKAD